MMPIDKCIKTLQTLTAAGDPNGIRLSKQSINEFLSTNPTLDSKVGALGALEYKFSGICPNEPGRQLDIANDVLDYIASRQRELANQL